jgi:hypothetical protein
MEGRRIGRIEEMRTGSDKGGIVREFLLGRRGLLERLSLARTLLGRPHSPTIVRWDQIDLSNPARPILTCRLSELKKEEPR